MVLQEIIQYCRISYSTVGCHIVLQDVIWYYRMSYVIVGSHILLQHIIQYCRMSYSIVGCHMVLQDVIRYCMSVCALCPKHRTASLLYPPLGHYLVGIREVAVDIFHLEGVSITDLVIRASIISTLNHDDITSWTAQVNWVALAGQFPPDQTKWQCSPTEAWGREEEKKQKE